MNFLTLRVVMIEIGLTKRDRVEQFCPPAQ